jgi:hypothetical protein
MSTAISSGRLLHRILCVTGDELYASTDIGRHHRKPTLFTTNLPYATWPDFLANPALTEVLLSRLREHCHTITIDGPCIRPQTG